MTSKSKNDMADGARGVPFKVPDAWLVAARAEMESRGWSQQKLADFAGVSQAGVSRMLAGQTSTVVLHRVAKALALPDPTAQLHDEELQEAIYLVTRLREFAPKAFGRLVRALRAHVGGADALEIFADTVAEAEVIVQSAAKPATVVIRKTR